MTDYIWFEFFTMVVDCLPFWEAYPFTSRNWVMNHGLSCQRKKWLGYVEWQWPESSTCKSKHENKNHRYQSQCPTFQNHESSPIPHKKTNVTILNTRNQQTMPNEQIRDGMVKKIKIQSHKGWKLWIGQWWHWHNLETKEWMNWRSLVYIPLVGPPTMMTATTLWSAVPMLAKRKQPKNRTEEIPFLKG